VSIRNLKGLTGQKAADALGVTPATVCQWDKKGWLVRHPDGSIDITATKIKVGEFRSPFVGGKPDRGAGPKPQMTPATRVVEEIGRLEGVIEIDGWIDIVEARRQREVAEAKIAQMKEAQMRGELIPLADAERIYVDHVLKAKANFEAIPGRCAEMLAGRDEEGGVHCGQAAECLAGLVQHEKRNRAVLETKPNGSD